VCSASLNFDNDTGVLISACRFGDGARAALLDNLPNGKRRVELKACGSLHCPEERKLLRFEHKQGMLRNILMPQVPGRASVHAASVLRDVLAELKVDRSQVAGWILHPGGREILLALSKHL